MSIRGKRVVQALCIIYWSLFTALYAGSVTLHVGANEVVEGSSLEVKIIAEGKDIEFPEIRDIGGFPIEERSVSGKIESSYINGNFSSKSIKTLSFRFFPEIDVTIPAFEVSVDGGKRKTKPVKIRVVKASKASKKSAGGYMLTMQSSKKSVYAGEPFVVTVNFFEPRNSSATKIEYIPPKFKDFFTNTLGKENLKRSAKGTTHELRYLLTAKKSGKLTISPPRARVGMRSFSSANRDPWGFFSNEITWHSVRAKPLQLTVKAVPGATDLVGDFVVTGGVDVKEVEANKPLTYTLKITGKGSLEDYVAPKFDIAGVTTYGNEAKISSSIESGSIVSSYEKIYVFIADSSFVIPQMTLKTFDYIAGKSRKLTTDSYSIHVKGRRTSTRLAVAPTISEQSHNTKPVVAESNQSLLVDSAYYRQKAEEEIRSVMIWYLLLAFVVGVLITVAAVRLTPHLSYRRKKRSRRHYTTDEALKLLYPHTDEDPRVEAMVRRLYEIKRGESTATVEKDELAEVINSVLEKRENSSES